MEIDYSPYLHVQQNGTIWWSLADAIKLGAGYFSMRDDQHNLEAVLRAKNNQVRANERTLWSEFSQDHYTDDHPRLLERDNCRYVEAHEFLDWLSRHLVAQTKSTIVFPGELARAVRKATGAPKAQGPDAPNFESLSIALEKWFVKPLSKIPKALRKRIEQELSPIPWDSLTGDQRRSLASQWDYQNDSATVKERQFWWDFFERMDVVKAHIAQWEAVATPTAIELAQKESRLMELRRELARMEAQTRQDRAERHPEPDPLPDSDQASISPSEPFSYIAYPKAIHLLIARLGATPEELAAWVWSGPKDGGLAAYMNANELDPPPRFFYAVGSDSHDYIAPLMACWFRADDIEQFEPADRYIGGAALIERWSKQAGLHATGFIQAKIAESRLLDIHPIYGGTRGTFSEHPDWPPLESGLFPLSQVEQIEAEDFDSVIDIAVDAARPPDAFDLVAHPDQAVVGSPEWRKKTAKAAADALHDQPGGSRDKQRQIRAIWASGKYSAKDVCAEQECAALNMSFKAARRALINAPKPTQC